MSTDRATWKQWESWCAKEILRGIRVPGSGSMRTGWASLDGDAVNDFWTLECKFSGEKRNGTRVATVHNSWYDQARKQGEATKKHWAIAIKLKAMPNESGIMLLPSWEFDRLFGVEISEIPRIQVKHDSFPIGEGIFRWLTGTQNFIGLFGKEKYEFRFFRGIRWDFPSSVPEVPTCLIAVGIPSFIKETEARGERIYEKGVKL